MPQIMRGLGLRFGDLVHYVCRTGIQWSKVFLKVVGKLRVSKP